MMGDTVLSAPKHNAPPIRTKLFKGEMDYFQRNPHVTGMAADDDRVILNPFSTLSLKERDAVVMNEWARILMRNHIKPEFDLTEEQAKNFATYSSNPQDIKETIAARILSGDPSAGAPTIDQANFVQRLWAVMGGEE